MRKKRIIKTMDYGYNPINKTLVSVYGDIILTNVPIDCHQKAYEMARLASHTYGIVIGDYNSFVNVFNKEFTNFNN